MRTPLSRFHRREFGPRLLTGGTSRPDRARLRALRSQLRAEPNRGVLRRTLGWIVIVLGLIAIPMPLCPGIVILPIGVALVGRRQWLIRWTRTRSKLLLRWAELRGGLLGRLGRPLAAAERRFAAALRRRRLARIR